jgi:hypothetical protein
MYEYIGALHMHSIFSDGSGKVEEIAGFADEVGLDFIVLTDHNTLRALKEGYEKWYGKTLLLVGCEINDKENKNHYLALNIKETYSTRISAKEYVKKIKDAGGIGFLAHPHEKRTHMAEHPPYPWTEWDTKDFTGIEIWNHMSEWMENLTEENKYKAFLHPLKTIEAPPAETLKVWDELSQERKVVGIGGVDAHAHKYNILGFLEVEVFPYKVLFKSIRTHILTDKKIKKDNSPQGIEDAKEIIYKALEDGRCFVANDYHAESKGFEFYAESGNQKYYMGETPEFTSDMKLVINLPAEKAEIRIIRNGKLYAKAESSNYEMKVKSRGVYRVEVFHNSNAWIYSNPIRFLK